jgi:phenylpropionate dioxygenase-like ring-hydroxylating dioxygenase large terminal subunit
VAITEANRELHTNAERWKVQYPPETHFADEQLLTEAQTRIPTARYTDPAFLEAEIEGVWKRVWQMACREEDVPNTGDYASYRIADQEYLVVRQADGSVKAFNNACRHRGNVVKRGCGSATELRCQYHHWCWNIDGSLNEIPDRHLYIRLDDAEYALGEIACDTWGGFVFVNPDTSCEPLLDFLGDVARQLEPYHLEKMRSAVNVTTTISCNWKVAVEAFLEVYHVQGIHPQLMPMLDDVNTSYEVMGPHSRMIVPFGIPSMRLEHVGSQEVFEAFVMESGNTAVVSEPGAEAAGGAAPTGLEDLFDEQGEIRGDRNVREVLIERTYERGTAAGHDYSGLLPDQMIDDWHYLIFPGMVFNTHAGGFLLFRVRPDWKDPDRCTFDLYRFLWPSEEEAASYQPAQNVEIPERGMSFGRVLDQDFENLPGVQRGLHSDALEFITLSAQEIRVAHVHEAIDEMLARATRA